MERTAYIARVAGSTE